MQEPGTQQDQPSNPLAPRQPILAVGTRNRWLFAYPTLDTAVEKLNADFLAGKYAGRLGAFDRYRLTDELRFFDAAGRELEPEWDPKVQPAGDKDAGYRLQTFRVRSDDPYVRDRFRVMLDEAKPDLQTEPREPLPPQLADRRLPFDQFCGHLAVALSDDYADGFWHRLLGGD